MSNLLSSRELSLLCPDCNHRLGSHKAQDRPGCLHSVLCPCNLKVSQILEHHKEKEEKEAVKTKAKVKVGATTALELFSE